MQEIKFMNIIDIARVCHEVNKAYCKSIGDDSQKSWNDCALWQRESAIAGVEYKLKNPDVTPEDQHNAWCKDKITAGWIFGLVKDSEKKTHPCLVSYDKLPQAQKAKDYLFCAVVESLKPYLK